MIGLLVAYGFDGATKQRWERFAASAGIANWIVVDNAGASPGAIAGTNRHYEFSGYREGLAAIAEVHGEVDSVVVFNDTLFSHHWQRGWRSVVRGSTGARPGIWGDGRIDEIEGGRTIEFLASWHFLLVGSSAQRVFLEALDAVLDDFGEHRFDMAYEQYLDRYLTATPFRGYSDPAAVTNVDERARKLACIRAEHRLSAVPGFRAVSSPYSGRKVRVARIADRLLSAARRFRSLGRAVRTRRR